MSELRLEDIISREAIEAPLILASNLEKAEKVLMRIRNSSEKVVADSDTATSMKKLTDSVSKLVTENKELEKVEKQLATAQAKNTDEYVKLKQKVNEVNQAVKSKVALGEKDSLVINKTNSSLKELQAALTKNRQAYASLRSEQERNSKEGQNLLKIIQEQDRDFKDLSATLGQHQANVGNYEGAITGLKQELKAARDEMVGIAKTLGTESPEFIAAAKKAGELKDQINDINDSVKNTEASGLENIANSFGDIGTKLKAGDFGGAANSARQFADALKGMSFKELKDQLGGFVSALGTMGKAILTNPIFLIAAAVAAAIVAFQYFKSEADKLAMANVDRAKREMDALTERYDHEIKLMSIAGKNTFEVERQKQKAIVRTAEKGIEAIGSIYEYDILMSLLTRQNTMKVNEEKAQQLADFVKLKEQAQREIEVIDAEEIEFTKKTQQEITSARKDGIIKLNEFRLQRQIDAAKEEINNEKLTFDQRADAALRLLTLEDEAAKMKRDNDLKQEGLTKEGRILIREKYFSESLEAEKDYAKNIQAIADQRTAQEKKNAEDEFKLKEFYAQQELDNAPAEKKIEKELALLELRFQRAIELTKMGTDEEQLLIEQQQQAINDIYKKYAKKKEEITQATAKTEEQIRTESIDKQIEDLKKLMAIYDQWGNQTLALFSALSERRISDIDSEIEKLDEKTKGEVQKAGDNDAAIAAIEANAEARREQLELKKKQEQKKAAVAQKASALFEAAVLNGINILNAARSAPPPFNIPAILAATAFGALQIATIAAKPIPQFEKGTDNAPEGYAIVGEKGPELKITPSGQTTLTPGTPTLDYLEAGTKIIPHDETMRMLALSAFGNQALIHREQLEKINLAHAIDASSDKIVKGLTKAIKANKPGNLVKQGRLIYEQLQNENGNIQYIRRTNLGY